MTKALAVLIAALVFATSACGSSEEDDDPVGPFDVTGYDRSCAMADECFVIFSGDPCGCACDQTAITSSEQSRYFADRDAYMERACPDGAVICGPCPARPAAVCSDGQCVLPP